MKKLLHLLILFAVAKSMVAQVPATVSYPFAVGRNNCGSGTERIHFYTYNSGTNTIANATGGLVGPCIPQLRVGTPVNGTQIFTSNYSSISYNPKDHKIYFFWTALPTSPTPSALRFLAYGGNPRTFVWSWSIGTCAGTAANKSDTLRSFQADILGVVFDNNGNGYTIDFTATAPFKGMLRSIDFSTGVMGPADTLSLTGGAKIYQSGSGDVAMSPSGQMFFVVDNKLFTPNYSAYTGTGSFITTTYIDTVRTSNSFVGLTYAQGETIAAYSGGGCPFEEIEPLTAAVSAITKNNTPSNVYSAVDMATVVSGIGVAKKLVSINPTGTPNQYNVVYELVVRNYGNTDVANVQVRDDLTAINGAANVSNVTTSFVSNPAGLVLNPGFNGNSDQDLLNGTGTLPNYPVANNNCIIRISCRLSGIQNGVVYNNRAVATAVGYNTQNLRDTSTNGNLPDLNQNDKPDDAGESTPTPLLIALTGHTLPCASLTNVLYTQNFGSGTGLVTTVPAAVLGSGAILPTGTVLYSGTTTAPILEETYTITENAINADNGKYNNLTDHTGNPNGRMLVVNADANNTVFYRGSFWGALCSRQQYSLNFYAAFLGNPSYQTVCDGFGGFKYPKVRVRVIDPVSGLIISELATGDIISTGWQRYGIKFLSPASYMGARFELINEGLGGCGNVIAFDDIQFGSCDPLPEVGLNHINAGCLGTSASFTAVLSDPGAILGTPDYQWQVSTDGVTWSNIGGAPNAPTYTIASVGAGDVNKYYRALVAASGNLGIASCRYASPTYFLKAGCDIDDDDDGIPDTVESGGVDPLDDDDLDNIPNYRDPSYPGFVDTNSDTVNDNFDWDLDGIINELDLDSDNDGIPDVVEAGGVDTNGDGKIDNYTDIDFDGFSQNVDANTSGKDLSGTGLALPDLDGDGVPNYFDLDSDNDGIPDVVEAYGADTNNDGIIDGYSDSDNDGYSDNRDGDVGNDGTAENSANALLRTGTDPDNNGRANTYPYKNMDNDTKTNPYDLDSDGDGITDVKEAQFTDADWNGRVDGAINSKGRNVALAALGSLTIPNTDGVGSPNSYDIDADDDGIPDNVEGQATLGYFLPAATDTDGDGIDNSYDNFSGFGGDGIHPVNTDGDANPDYLDLNTDADGVIDRIEGNDLNLNGLPDDLVTLLGTDADGDGLDDRFDANNSSAEATSARMGNGGTITGDPTPGSITPVQHTTVAWGCPTERDWRCLPYALSCEYVTFKGVLNNHKVQLDWSALCRQEIDYFIIERSTDRENFEAVFQTPGKPILNEIESYNGLDDVSGIRSEMIYYRLVSVMKSGRTSLSSIIGIRNSRKEVMEMRILPNPVSDQLQLLINSGKNGKASIEIIDGTGRKVNQFTEQLQQGSNTFSYTSVSQLPKGMYYVRMRMEETVIIQKFSKIK